MDRQSLILKLYYLMNNLDLILLFLKSLPLMKKEKFYWVNFLKLLTLSLQLHQMVSTQKDHGSLITSVILFLMVVLDMHSEVMKSIFNKEITSLFPFQANFAYRLTLFFRK